MTQIGQMIFEDGVRQGVKEGMQQERARMNRLIQSLAGANRMDDIIKASSDSSYQQKLFQEFGL